MQGQGPYRGGPAVVDEAVRPLTASKSSSRSGCGSARSPPTPQINDRSRLRAHEASVSCFTVLLTRTGYRGPKCERDWNGYGSTTIGGSPRARKGAAKLGNSSWRRPGTVGFNPVSDRSPLGEDRAYGAAPATISALIRCTVPTPQPRVRAVLQTPTPSLSAQRSPRRSLPLAARSASLVPWPAH